MSHAIRPVAVGDLDLICSHRRRMFEESGHADATLATMTEHFRRWLMPRLLDGSYFGWIVEVAGAPVAGLGMMVLDWPPHPTHPEDDRRGYILNVFVEPTYRKQGFARRLMSMADDEAIRRKLRHVILHATSQGRPMYEALGWTATREMARRY
jgi:GNAT superfamily N-acetyltransferase